MVSLMPILSQNAVAFEEKEEQKFNRDQFRACFAEMTKLVQEVSELKSKEMTADVSDACTFTRNNMQVDTFSRSRRRLLKNAFKDL